MFLLILCSVYSPIKQNKFSAISGTFIFDNKLFIKRN
jgi:hypothetical protein